MSDSDLQFHIRLKSGQAGRFVLLTGDPGRVPVIANYLENAEEITRNREFVTFTGSIDGQRASVVSTGIGGPSTAIAVEELAKVGADTFIRLGTAGSLAPHVRLGDLCVATAAVRDEGTSRAYMPASFPAIADYDIVGALTDAARAKGHPYRAGIIRSADSFYGDVEPETMPYHASPLDTWRAAGVLCSEMETSTLLVVASIRRLRAGAILAIVNQPGRTIDADSSLATLIETAVEGMRRVIHAEQR